MFFLQAVAFIMHSLLYVSPSLAHTGDHNDEHSMLARQTQVGLRFRILQIIPPSQRTRLQRSKGERRMLVGYQRSCLFTVVLQRLDASTMSTILNISCDLVVAGRSEHNITLV